MILGTVQISRDTFFAVFGPTHPLRDAKHHIKYHGAFGATPHPLSDAPTSQGVSRAFGARDPHPLCDRVTPPSSSVLT